MKTLKLEERIKNLHLVTTVLSEDGDESWHALFDLPKLIEFMKDWALEMVGEDCGHEDEQCLGRDIAKQEIRQRIEESIRKSRL